MVANMRSMGAAEGAIMPTIMTAHIRKVSARSCGLHASRIVGPAIAAISMPP
jgi:hypothetical protein